MKVMDTSGMALQELLSLLRVTNTSTKIREKYCTSEHPTVTPTEPHSKLSPLITIEFQTRFIPKHKI